MTMVSRVFADASAADQRQARVSLHAELPSSKAKREQTLRNILAARRRQILNQRPHEPPRILASRTPRPSDTTSKDPPDILETQETKHNVYVSSTRTETSIEEEIPQSSKKPVEEVSSAADAGSTGRKAESQTSKMSRNEASSITDKRESASSSTIASTLPSVSAGQKPTDADARKKNTVSMPESLYKHFRPVESNIPVEDMSQFLYFGQKLQPDAQNVTGNSNNNSVETTSAIPVSSRRRYSAKRFSATMIAPAEEIVSDEMNIALERRTVEKNQVSRIKNTFRSPGSGIYYRKPRPTTDVASNVIPSNESSIVVNGLDVRNEMNAVDDKSRRDEGGDGVQIIEMGTTTTWSPRQHDDDIGASVASSEINVKYANATVMNGINANSHKTPSDLQRATEAMEVRESKTDERKLTSSEMIPPRTSPRSRESEGTSTMIGDKVETTMSSLSLESSTLRIVVPDQSFGSSGFAIDSERVHRNTVKQQPVADPVANRPVRVTAGVDVAPKSSVLAPSTTETFALAADSKQSRSQQQQQQQQQHVYAYTITNVTRLLRNYTGTGLSGEERRGGGTTAARRTGSGAEITSGGPSSQQRPQQQQQLQQQQQHQQQQQQQSPPQPPPLPPPPPSSSSPLLLPRASIEPARTPARLSAGATVEPVTAVGASASVVGGSLVGERPRKVVPQQQQQQQQQQQRASSQGAAIWSLSHSAANDSAIALTGSTRSSETGSRGSVRWNHAKSRISDQEGANDRRFLRKSASAVLNQRSTVNDESSLAVTSKRRRVLTQPIALSSPSRRVNSNDREKVQSVSESVLVVNDRLSNGTITSRANAADDEDVGSPRESARASGVNEVPSDSNSTVTTMGNLSRNSSAIDDTTDSTDPSILVDAITTTERSSVLAEDAVTVPVPSAKDEDSISESAAGNNNQSIATPKIEDDVDATMDNVAATTMAVTERDGEIVTVTSTTTTTVMAPVFPVTPKILTEEERTTAPPEAFTLRPADAGKVPEVSNLDPSEIQKRYRSKDATTTLSPMPVSPIRNDTRPVNDAGSVSNGKAEVSVPPTPVIENGRRIAGERSPEVRARNLSDKSKDKDDVLPIMHLYNTSDIFNGSGLMDGFVRGTERPRVVLPVEAEPVAEEDSATITTTMTTERIHDRTTIVSSSTEITGSSSTTVPVSRIKEPHQSTPTNPRRDKHEENRDPQDAAAAPVFKGSSFGHTVNRTRYRPAYHHSILPEYNGTLYHPIELNRTFFESGGPISVSPRESMNISEVISKRHDGDAIATQETVAVVSYILATLVVFPIAVGVGLILRRLILRNRKVLIPIVHASSYLL